MIGASREMNKIFTTIKKKVADTPANILILGESGTGKELSPGRSTPIPPARADLHGDKQWRDTEIYSKASRFGYESGLSPELMPTGRGF